MTKYCPKCFREFPDDSVFCSECGVMLESKSESNSNQSASVGRVLRTVRENDSSTDKPSVASSQNATNKSPDIPFAASSQNVTNKSPNNNVSTGYSANQATNTIETVGSFKLAENEIVIKRYLCAYIGRGLTSGSDNKGYLTVTNQRVIYEGKGKNSMIAMETPIANIGAIQTYQGVNYNIRLILIAAVLVLAGLMLGKGMPMIMLFAIAALLLFFSYRTSYQLLISSSAVAGTAIAIGEGPTSVLGNSAFYTLEASPTSDSLKMIGEIGALIHDVQMLGDRAIEKWK